jgi:hypothetical protein
LRPGPIIETVRPRAINSRDAGLALISRINRWFVAGAVVLTGAISLAAARSFHGHSTASTSSTSAPAQSSGSGSSSSSSGSGLQQPTSSPSPAPAQSAPAAVVSGGS